METAGLKAFAREARRRLKAQVAAKLALVLEPNSAARREDARAVAALEGEVARGGEPQVIERVAYLWFNRFCALCFMDANGFTGPRAVSPAEGDTRPELLAEALAGHLPDTLLEGTAARVRDLIDGRAPSRDPQGEAYRLLLVAACNGWSEAMPFLFEGVDDASELLMPEDLLSSDGVLARMRAALSDEVARDVEAIGWLYQFYIAEKKDEVFAALKKNVKVTPENIPAATQLFTPHWIVRYLVENSLGRLWLLNRPGSGLAAHMPYYIAPVDVETEFLRVASPEELRICDPACGSGHMLTYAFDLLHRIYEEAGYDPGEIPALILRHNLYGIEIDERAGALAAFALVMKAAQALPAGRRRRFLREPVSPNVTVLEEVRFRPDELERYINAAGDLAVRDLFTPALRETLTQFAEVKNFGSLIRPVLPDPAEVRRRLEARGVGGDLMLAHVHRDVLRVLAQAEILLPRYHVVVANPPYMGGKGMNARLGKWAKDNYADSKDNLFAMFMERALAMTLPCGFMAMINMQSWMFLSSFERMRRNALATDSIITLAHLGERAFDSIGGVVVSTTAFIIQTRTTGKLGAFIRLVDGKSEGEKNQSLLMVIADRPSSLFFERKTSDIVALPGARVLYWIPQMTAAAFARYPAISDSARGIQGIITGNNATFLRYWAEVSFTHVARPPILGQHIEQGDYRWVGYTKGGDPRRWFGNNEYVLDWSDSGRSLTRRRSENSDLYFAPCITWNKISTNSFTARMQVEGYLWDVAGSSLFPDRPERLIELTALMCSRVATSLMQAISPTLNFEVETVLEFPCSKNTLPMSAPVVSRAEQLIALARADWDAYETSWDFARHPLLDPAHRRDTLAETYAAWRAHAQAATDEMRALEEENNRFFIDAYGLADELTPEVPLHEITLTANPHYRYGAARADGDGDRGADGEALMRADTARELVSYAVGCLMGRYSLDRDGLVLADAGATAAEYLNQVPEPTLLPDADGILPLTEGEWFADDAAAGVRRVLRRAFGADRFEDNLRWLEDSLGKDLRRWLGRDFFADHVKRYRKRPIYWLFSSPKGTFQALAYLHRMTGDTVALVLNDYLRPMRAKLDAAMHAADAASRDAPSAVERTRALKQVDVLRRQIAELDAWERDVMHPLAGRRIALDLDDGVKRNYPKLGAALRKIPGLEAAED